MSTNSVPNLIVLNEADNVATALRDLPGGQPAAVSGTDGALSHVTPVCESRLGHKVAIHEIPAGGLVVKHGYPIGRATKAIGIGEHVHVHNVTSLSRETDVAVNAATGEGD